MNDRNALLDLAELLHRALKAQAHYAQDHPQAHHALEEAYASLRTMLQSQSPLVMQIGEGKIYFQGTALEGREQTIQSLAREMGSRQIGGLVFHLGMDSDELQLLFFALQLNPQRLAEMGGPRSLLPDDGHLRVLDPERPADAGPAPAEDPAAEPLPPISGPLPPVVLADELRRRFSSLIQKTAAVPKRTFHMPWTSEHREVMRKHGLKVPDFGGMAGVGEELRLDQVDPVALREILRTTLSLLSPLEQGAVLLGIATFPKEELALRRALDYLGPELLAQVTAHVHVTSGPSRFELALLVSSLLHCTKDRELALESIRGRLQFEGWGIHEVDQLREAILWECQGTDTKMQQGLADRGIFELDPQQVMILVRQIVRGHRYTSLADLLHQLEVGIASPQPERRGQAAEIVADLSECLEEPGIPAEQEVRLHRMLHDHLASESEPLALRWSCQAMEALLGHWIRSGRFDAAYKELVFLTELSVRIGQPPPKVKALRDMAGRMGSPPNMATIVPMLHDPAFQLNLAQLHALLALLGTPAADYIAACLRMSEDDNHRAQLGAALRAIGRAAVTPLRDLLACERPEVVALALVLLADIGHPGALEEIALTLGYPDLKVRRTAIGTLARLGGAEAVRALAAFFPGAEPVLQMDCLEAFTLLRDPASVLVLGEFLQASRASDLEVAKVRLRTVETLGLLGSAEAVPALQEMFKKKGFLGGRESTGMRLAAAKALACIGGRASREALALILDGEKEEEVRGVIRQFLVGTGGGS